MGTISWVLSHGYYLMSEKLDTDYPDSDLIVTTDLYKSFISY